MPVLDLLVQCVLVALLAGWLVVGAWENIRAPEVNRALVRDVFSMTTMAAEAPEVYEQVKANRMTSRPLQDTLFRLVVLFETAVAAGLVAGTILLALAVVGLAPAGLATGVAVLATLGFTLIWGLFLVGGNWFHYWVTHKQTQHTHYFMTFWGILTLIVLLP